MGLGPSSSSYLVGNRVYNGGTNSPNSGTLNPSGYIERELKKKTASTRRSGLAATALRMQQNSGSKIPAIRNIAQLPPTPTNPTVVSNPQGRLILSEKTPVTPATPDPTSPNNVLPYDPQTAAQQLLLQKQEQDYLNNLQVQRQQLAEGITTKQREIDLNAPGQFRNLLNNYAGRGMAYSSGYGYQYGQTEADIERQRADLLRQLQEGNAGFDSNQQSSMDDYQLALAQLMNQNAESSSQDAGNLGLAPAPTKTPKANKPGKSKPGKSKGSNLSSSLGGSYWHPTPKFTNHKAAAKRIQNKNKKGGK